MTRFFCGTVKLELVVLLQPDSWADIMYFTMFTIPWKWNWKEPRDVFVSDQGHHITIIIRSHFYVSTVSLPVCKWMNNLSEESKAWLMNNENSRGENAPFVALNYSKILFYSFNNKLSPNQRIGWRIPMVETGRKGHWTGSFYHGNSLRSFQVPSLVFCSRTWKECENLYRCL